MYYVVYRVVTYVIEWLTNMMFKFVQSAIQVLLSLPSIVSFQISVESEILSRAIDGSCEIF